MQKALAPISMHQAMILFHFMPSNKYAAGPARKVNKNKKRGKTNLMQTKTGKT
jgi:hypothetical protein